jgi:hypothetical protein
MEWFVQTPQYSFKNTFWHSILLVVFSLGRCHFYSTRFHTEWCANGALRIQLGFCRLTNMSVAAIYEMPECLEIACEAMRDAKRPSFFAGLAWNESNRADRPVEASYHVSLLWQHSCWSNGKTQVESARMTFQDGGRATLRLNSQSWAIYLIQKRHDIEEMTSPFAQTAHSSRYLLGGTGVGKLIGGA